MTWQAFRIDELDSFPTGPGPLWRPVRRRVDARAFGVNAWTGESPGDPVIERHREPDGVEEVYVVLEGRATFTVGEDTVDAPRGTFVYVPSGTLREAIAAEPATTVLAVGAKPGEVFEPSMWEEVFLAEGYRRRGDVVRARDIMREHTATYPGEWRAHFNRACFESVAGDTDAALASLRRSFELNADETREYAATDEDFDPIRNDPRYKELIG
jgi:quercetin dioxygenase-like cupin family protein